LLCKRSAGNSSATHNGYHWSWIYRASGRSAEHTSLFFRIAKYETCKLVALPRLQESDFFRSLKAARPFFLMAGPNVVESEAHCLKMARQIKAVTDALGLPLVFKCSFDKANRTSAASFRGPGLEEGLRRAPCRLARCSLPGPPAQAVWPAGLTAVSACRPG